MQLQPEKDFGITTHIKLMKVNKARVFNQYSCIYQIFATGDESSVFHLYFHQFYDVFVITEVFLILVPYLSFPM